MIKVSRKIKIKKRIKPKKEQEQIKKVAILISCFLILIILAITSTSLLSPKITLTLNNKKIGKTITLNYKEKYIEPDYKAIYQNKDITDKVVVTGTVNTKKIGAYKIYYKMKEGLFAHTYILKVIVKDKSSPAIKLRGNSITDVCPNTEYKEEGFSAYDNVDKDITKKVKVKRVKDKIIYSVRDSSGNYKEVIRTLVYQDKKSPTISLKGSEYETVYLDDTYHDSGVDINDNCTKKDKLVIKTIGEVDTKRAGRYEMCYIAEDEAGNKEEIKRVINVVEHGQNGTIYLTFDDGPKNGTTNVILDILKEEGVKATFFITNNGPDELVKREYEEGHTVGLHTASHDYATIYSSKESYYNDLYSVRDRVKRITGQDAKIIRFPGGSSNTISRRYSEGIMSLLTKDVITKGFFYYDWNLASGDAGELHTSDAIYENVTRNLSKDRVNIVLMHDIKPYTRDALKSIIHYGKENGYIFDKITEKTEMMTQRVNN